MMFQTTNQTYWDVALTDFGAIGANINEYHSSIVSFTAIFLVKQAIQ